MLARLVAQMLVVTNALANFTPLAAMSSMLGVWMIRLPMHPIVSHR